MSEPQNTNSGWQKLELSPEHEAAKRLADLTGLHTKIYSELEPDNWYSESRQFHDPERPVNNSGVMKAVHYASIEIDKGMGAGKLMSAMSDIVNGMNLGDGRPPLVFIDNHVAEADSIRLRVNDIEKYDAAHGGKGTFFDKLMSKQNEFIATSKEFKNLQPEANPNYDTKNIDTYAQQLDELFGFTNASGQNAKTAYRTHVTKNDTGDIKDIRPMPVIFFPLIPENSLMTEEAKQKHIERVGGKISSIIKKHSGETGITGIPLLRDDDGRSIGFVAWNMESNGKLLKNLTPIKDELQQAVKSEVETISTAEIVVGVKNEAERKLAAERIAKAKNDLDDLHVSLKKKADKPKSALEPFINGGLISGALLGMFSAYRHSEGKSVTNKIFSFIGLAALGSVIGSAVRVALRPVLDKMFKTNKTDTQETNNENTESLSVTTPNTNTDNLQSEQVIAERKAKEHADNVRNELAANGVRYDEKHGQEMSQPQAAPLTQLRPATTVQTQLS